MPEPRFLLDGLRDRARDPTTWFAREHIDAARTGLVAQRFARERALPHVVLPLALDLSFAGRVAAELERAPFVRHPYGAYPIDVARVPDDAPGELAAFLRWLASDDATRFHTALVHAPLTEDGGLPDARAVQRVQVQASRIRAGQRFPRHIDTADPGIAAVYNLSRDLDPGGLDGGVLRFDAGDGPALQVPPAFGTLAVFRADSAAHEVTPVTHASAARYTITAFYLLRPTSPGA